MWRALFIFNRVSWTICEPKGLRALISHSIGRWPWHNPGLVSLECLALATGCWRAAKLFLPLGAGRVCAGQGWDEMG